MPKLNLRLDRAEDELRTQGPKSGRLVHAHNYPTGGELFSCAAYDGRWVSLLEMFREPIEAYHWTREALEAMAKERGDTIMYVVFYAMPGLGLGEAMGRRAAEQEPPDNT